MLEYIIVGLLSVALAYVCSHVKGKARYVFACIAGFPSAMLAAVRFNIGPDYPLYVRIFETIKATGSFFSVKALEPGFELLNRMVIMLGGDKEILFLLIAWIISTFFFMAALRMSNNFVFSVASFFAMGIYCDSLNGLRQYIAASITLFALSFLCRGERAKAVFSCLFAALFHQSALIMVAVCLVVDRVRLSSWKAICLVAIFLVGGSFLFDFVNSILAFTRYSYYLGSIEYVVEPTLGTTLLTSVLTVFAFSVGVYKDGGNDSSVNRVLSNMNILALLSALLSFFIPLALRIQYYFVPIEMLFMPYAVSYIKNGKMRFLVGSMLFLLFLAMNVIGMVFNGWYGAYPFQIVR